MRALRIFNRSRMRPWHSSVRHLIGDRGLRLGPVRASGMAARTVGDALRTTSTLFAPLHEAVVDTWLILLQFRSAHKRAQKLGSDHVRIKKTPCNQSVSVTASNPFIRLPEERRNSIGRGVFPLGAREPRRSPTPPTSYATSTRESDPPQRYRYGE